MKPSARRWRAILVVGSGSADVQTITLDGKGGIAGGLTRKRQSNRRLDVSHVSEQFASDRPAWRFAGDPHEATKADAVWDCFPGVAFNDIVEPVGAIGIPNRDKLWTDDNWLWNP
jgi:hypothetical protein